MIKRRFFLVVAIITYSTLGCMGFNNGSVIREVNSSYAGQWKSSNFGASTGTPSTQSLTGNVSLQFNADLSFSRTITADVFNDSGNTFVKKQNFNFTCVKNSNETFSGIIKTESNIYKLSGYMYSDSKNDLSFIYYYTNQDNLEWSGSFQLTRL